MTLLPPVFSAILSGLLRLAGRQMRRLRRDTGGNMMIIMGLSAVPLIFAVGFGIDYSRAQKMQTKLTAIADSAALLAVSPVYLGKTDDVAAAAAQAQFDAQTTSLKGVTITSRSVTAVTTSSGSLGGRRVATATYHATSTNMFGKLLAYFTGNANSLSLPIGGTVQANASQPPSINFYVVLDTSPSMLLPTTTSGISSLSGATKNSSFSNGCDFACHTQHLENIPLSVTDSSGRAVWLASSSASSGYNVYYLINTSTKIVYNSAGTALGTFKSVTTPTSSGMGTLTYTVTSGKTTTTYTVSGMYADTWWLARNFGLIRGSPSSIELRIDAETTAARNLVTFAQNTVATYNTTTHPVTYKMQFYQFSYGNPTALTSAMTDVNSLTTATVPDLGLNSPLLYTFNYWTSASTQTNDADSDFAKMFTTMNTTIPAPGDGSTPSTPQEVMFIVTDGMVDQAVSGYSCQSSGRACTQLLASHLTQCTTIKNRGIRIAVLYTEYLASTIQGFGLSFANTIATSAVPNIEAQLQSCASTNPDGTLLYYKVSADEDISSALTQLFSMAVQTAYLAR